MKLAKAHNILPEDVASSFKNGYLTFEIIEDMTVHRRFGGSAVLKGNFATTTEMLSRSDLALLTEWNTMQFDAQIVIPKGTIINYGKIIVG